MQNLAICNLSRLENFPFPDEVAALEHVLELIDEMLMPLEEAVVKAAGTNRVDWLEHLFEDYDGDFMDAVTAAASKGYQEAVICMVQEIDWRENGGDIDQSDSVSVSSNSESDSVSINSSDQSDSVRESDSVSESYSISAYTAPLLKKAVEAAAQSGQADIIKLFLPQLVTSWDNISEMYTITWNVLDQAAASGHLNVVIFVVDYASQWGYITEYTPSGEEDAVWLAVGSGHDQVAILLQLYSVTWNVQNALEEALDMEQHEIAEWILALGYAEEQQLHQKWLDRRTRS
ncbi:unnamed protein product [Phytophthora fragariaefolia]|uniref:Unnamed protein product n=1 Tax=Phytophthora fragariaefolia TaxID=1490495 RepID=A0A9W6XT40_9STRA|nr:unnamed protein product [Phytophthora fragariaefolia]